MIELVRNYSELFNKHCWHHDCYDLPTLHLIIGQLPEVRKIKVYYQSETHYIDLRFHFCYMAPTGTGKGAGANFVKNICDLVGLNMQTVITATDAGLIGQPHKTTVYNPHSRSFEEVIVIEKGLLHPDKGVNILLYPEASTLFKENMSAYVQERADYFQIVMNPLGSNDNKLTKRLAIDYIVEFNPCCSLFFTTYEPEGLFSTLINRGLLQRMYFIINQIDDNLRMKMVEQSILMTTGADDEAKRREVEAQKVELANEIKKVNEFAKGIKEMRKNNDVNEGFKALVKIMLDTIKDCPQPAIKDQMFKFVQRYFEIAYKIAVHHALMRKDTSITQEDIVYAKNLILISWKKLQTLMETRYMVTSSAAKREMLHDKVIIEKLEELKKEEISMTELRKLIMENLGYSLHTAISYIDGLVRKGYIERIEGTSKYKLTGKKVILV